MHSNYILYSAANLLLCHMFLVGNVQKSPIASHLKGLDPSLEFYCQGPALTGVTESGQKQKMSVCISLTLETSEMFLSLRMIFNLERAAVWAILASSSDVDPCRTPIVVLNQSSMLSLNWTARWSLSYIQ